MPTAEDRRRFTVASVVGAALAFAAWAWMLLMGRADLLVREPYGNFYDAQARALLHGHWSVSATELGWEGFLIHGKTSTYFGPWPAILRMPFVELAPSTYGRLTQLSMLLAFAVLLVGAAMLHWRIRTLLRPEVPLGRGELALAAAVPIVIGCGSSAYFLASRAWVYHEAILWGAAWSLVAYERILAFTMRPSGSRLAVASLTATLAFASRASVGLGPVIALGLVFTGQLVRALHGRLRRNGSDDAAHSERGLGRLLGSLEWLGVERTRTRRDRGWLGATLIATLVPAAAYVYVNWARFHTLFTVPWRRQLLFKFSATARAPLEANHGSYFSIKYAPTALLQYLRPDALSLDGLFPWVTYPRFRTPVVGNVVINALDFSSSVTASMLGLSILTGVGIVGALWSRRFARTEHAARLRVLLIGASVGVVLVVTIAFIAQRYLGDWLPLVAIGAIAGFHVLLRRRETSPRPSRARTVVIAVLATLTVLGVWVNGSLAIVYQRLLNPVEGRLRPDMLDLQYRVAGATGIGGSQVEQVRTLPRRPARGGTLAIVGDCAHLYWSNGRIWVSVGGTPEGGVVRIRAAVPPATDRSWQPLVSWTTPTGTEVVGLRRDGDGVKLARSVAGPDGSVQFNDSYSARIRVDDRTRHDFVVTVARALHQLEVTIDDVPALSLDDQGRLPSGTPTVGRSNAVGVNPVYAAPIRELAPDTRLCDRARDAAR